MTTMISFQTWLYRHYAYAFGINNYHCFQVAKMYILGLEHFRYNLILIRKTPYSLKAAGLCTLNIHLIKRTLDVLSFYCELL